MIRWAVVAFVLGGALAGVVATGFDPSDWSLALTIFYGGLTAAWLSVLARVARGAPEEVEPDILELLERRRP